MLTTRIYYLARPMIPRNMQIFMRRNHFRMRFLRYKDRWPIYAERLSPPNRWGGWPDGKRFAFVLTHDVDTGYNHNRIFKLMKLEQDLGFTSSFNIVPERYEISEEIRWTLTRNGFEVGVHDLRHDGKLFASQKDFLQSAVKINGYLREWGSVGFRAGAMHHDLDLMHNLDIEYDCSTFDFDPFEPQPDGVGTIFPFWVKPKKNGKGYVELPYTLPQDFTLFVLMRSRNIDLWKKKLDWVVANGGMVLLITHPDYMNFDDDPIGPEEYSYKHYRELLEYVKKRYAGEYWNVLPRDVARFWVEKMVDVTARS